jgi:hypothetical protein
VVEELVHATAGFDASLHQDPKTAAVGIHAEHVRENLVK